MSDPGKDIDELQSDIEDDADESIFHIGDRLQPPKASLYTTQQLHTFIHEGLIDLAPPYQRDVVWTEPKQIKLLDSIYRNFYVPPVVFAVYMEDGEEVRRCVDGKQRLTSIQKFLDGQIPYKDPVTKKSYWFTCAESQKKSRLEVPEYWKQDFTSKQITCVEYNNLPRGFERDIFQRVQLGMPLTAAEKLQAIASPWADWIFQLDAQFISSDEGLTSIIDVDMKRGRDFQSLAQLVYCCNNYPEQTTPTAQKMEQWIARMEPPTPEFTKAIKDVMTKFWHLASQPLLKSAFTQIQKRVAPIEFVFIGVVLYVMRQLPDEDYADEVRAQEIHDMRVHVRKRFTDVRSRSDVIKVLWEFVQDVVERQDADNFSSVRRVSGDVNGKRKKKRRKDESDEEEDYYNSSRLATQTAKRSKGKGTR